MLSNLSIARRIIKKLFTSNIHLCISKMYFTRYSGQKNGYLPSAISSILYRREASAMPRKGENIYKRKDGRWEGRYICFYDTANKAKYAYVYGRTYGEVRQKLIERRSSSGQQMHPQKQAMIYSELLDLWLNSSQLSTKESTHAHYTQLISTHIKPQLGSYSLSCITPKIIENFIKLQLSEGRLDNTGGLAPKTVADILSIVKSTIEYAKYLDLPMICNLNKLTVKKKDKEIRVLSDEEQKLLLSVLLTNTDPYKFGVFLSLYTGIRIGELCALQWEDFDFAHNTVKINKTIQRIQNTEGETFSKTKVVITEPKSKCSVRTIPLPIFVADTAARFVSSPNAYILTGKDHYAEPRTMQNRFKAIVKECGISDVNFHALRHTFATRCIEAGFEIKSLSEILGHANVNIIRAARHIEGIPCTADRQQLYIL